jgi:hypothetical protein
LSDIREKGRRCLQYTSLHNIIQVCHHSIYRLLYEGGNGMIG